MARSLALQPPGYINLEFLLIGAFSVFLPRGIVFVLLLLESIADFALAIEVTYGLSLKDQLSSLHSLYELPTSRILEMSSVFALVIAVCAAIAIVRSHSEDRLWITGGFWGLFAIVAFIAVLRGQNSFMKRDTVYTYTHLARAPGYSLMKHESLFSRKVRASHHTDSGEMDSASARAMAYLDRPDAVKSPDVVLIVVESWGLPLDAHLAQALNAPYDDLRVARKFDVSFGSVRFEGSTVSGEARELCHSTMGLNILVATPDLLEGCLPALFHARNYENLSVHGYFGGMFQREAWYPKIGFDRSWFLSDLDRLNLPDCNGVFPGTCDAAIAQWIGTSLLSVDTGKPRFIYWVTLNSHLAVPAHPDLPNDDLCSTLPSLQKSVPLCSWSRLLRNVHQSVQRLALAPSARPVVFVVVGDHVPPFADTQLRQNFSATDVPYVLLTPINQSHLKQIHP
jgi:phosphoglycerol transferase MdoB-like AlkP superfamily enzyme